MGNWPSARWPSARSTSHLLKNAWTSQLKRAVRDVNLGIAGPAQSLVALGTVGRDVDEIGSLGPVDVAVELVEHRGRSTANRPTTGVSLERATPVTVLPSGGDFSPVISTYWKP